MRTGRKLRKKSRTTVKIVQAPAPYAPPGAPVPLNRVESVELGEGEGVQWIWTSAPGGASYVTGYRIVPDP